jgi:hypothetical protein
MISTEEILLRSSSSALNQQLENGSFQPGHNGPYMDPETPVRNTSHWLISFLKSYELTGDQKFKVAGEKALGYLMSSEARPNKFTFFHRKNSQKDQTNGVMGQAWTLEALEFAYRKLGDDQILKLAREVFQMHPYDDRYKAWKIVNLDGSIRGFDFTLNHQLWFAAIGNLIANHGDSEFKSEIDDFFNSLPKILKTYKNGVIKHFPILYQKPGLKKKLGALRYILTETSDQKEHLYTKSVGYHGFNLYALGLIYAENPELAIFKTNKFRSMIQVLDSEDFKIDLKNSKYSFDYNPPGFELGFALQTFGDPEKAFLYLNEDIEHSWSEKSEMWGVTNKYDPQTAAARVYESYQLIP